MKKIISGVLSAVMLTSVLCACNDGGNQSNSSQSGNNANSSQQTVTTEVATTQPATEPNYEDTNYVAPIPPKNQTYKFEEISLDEAAIPNGFSIDDSKFQIYNATVQGDYLVLKIKYNSSDSFFYNVIYDFDGNMVANISNIAIEEGYKKSALICGLCGDYTMIEMETSDYQEKAALYNLKTKEIKYIDSQYDTAWLDNGVIIVGKHGDDEYGYKYGALDLDFNDIIPIEYDGLSLISPELFMVKKEKEGEDGSHDEENDRFGLIDFNNKVVADIKYKKILPFTGVEGSGSREWGNFQELISFEKNINKYTVAVDENDKVVLIDKNGNTSDVNVEMTESNLEDGRVICLYQDKTYIKTIKSLDSIDSIIYDLDSNLITEKAAGGSSHMGGFYNGYCITYDEKGTNLIDINGKVIYSKTIEQDMGFKVYPVDEKGLFTITYYSDEDVVKSEIVDLNGTVIYTSDSDSEIEAFGNGFFRQHNDRGYAVYKVAAE